MYDCAQILSKLLRVLNIIWVNLPNPILHFLKLSDITQTAEFSINFTQTSRKCDFTQLFK